MKRCAKSSILCVTLAAFLCGCGCGGVAEEARDAAVPDGGVPDDGGASQDVSPPSDTGLEDVSIPDTGGGDAGTTDGGHDGGAKKIVFVQAHYDDEIIYLCTINEKMEAGHEVHSIWTKHPNETIEGLYGGPQGYPLAKGLGVDPGNLHFNEDLYEPPSDPSDSAPEYEAWLIALLERLSEQLGAIRPDEVFVQQWCGGHFQHDIAHVATLAVLKKNGLAPVVREARNRNLYYVDAAPSICHDVQSHEDLVDCLEWWDRHSLLIPPKEEVVSCADSEQARVKELAAAKEYKVEWIAALHQNQYYTDDDGRYMMDLFSKESHKRYQEHNYTQRPYGPTPDNPDGSLGYEPSYSFEDDWKKVVLKTVREWMNR